MRTHVCWVHYFFSPLHLASRYLHSASVLSRAIAALTFANSSFPSSERLAETGLRAPSVAVYGYTILLDIAASLIRSETCFSAQCFVPNIVHSLLLSQSVAL